jgi:hypothetical protein
MRVKKVIRVVAFSSVILFVTGCGSVYRTNEIIGSEPYADSWKDPHYFSIQNGDAGYLINPRTYNPAAARDPKNGLVIGNRDDSLYSKALSSSDSDPNKAIVYRNTLQNAIIGVADKTTKQHLADLKATQNNMNIFLGAAALGLTGGASLAAATTAKALSAAATGIIASRELFNNQTYRDALVESLTGAILSNQQNYYNNFIVPKQALPLAKYDVEAAINDAVTYNTYGSFYYGLQLIQNDVNKANSNRTNNPSQNQLLTNLLATPPSFTTQPAAVSVTVALGPASAQFKAVATGGATQYSWELSTDGVNWQNLSEGAPYSGTTTSTLTVNPVTTAMNSYQYRCLATDTSSKAKSLSNAAVLSAK